MAALKGDFRDVNGRLARVAPSPAVLGDLRLPGRSDFYWDQVPADGMKSTTTARSAVNNPDILLSHKPVFDLNVSTRRRMTGLFRRSNDGGKTVLKVTYGPGFPVFANSHVRVERGRIQEGKVLG